MDKIGKLRKELLSLIDNEFYEKINKPIMRVINCKTYKTETSKLVGHYFYIRKRCNRVLCYLYKKRNGEYFLRCFGGDKTWYQWYDFLTDDNAYNEPLYHKYWIGEFLVPLVTNEDIEYYSELAMNSKY